MNDLNEKIAGKNVMEAIRKGAVRMRPRWQFVLTSILVLLGVLIVLIALLYFASLAVFFLHDSGAWFAPAFGPRGWGDFIAAAPWRLVLLVAAFVLLLEFLVRRYAFVYKKPLLVSVLFILVLVTIGGIFIGRMPFHRVIAISAHRGEAPPAIAFLYGDKGFRPRPPGELYRGIIVSMGTSSFIIANQNRSGTTTVHLSPRTRLPNGGDFGIGALVIVIGDETRTGSVHAFGVQEVGE